MLWKQFLEYRTTGSLSNKLLEDEIQKTNPRVSKYRYGSILRYS